MRRRRPTRERPSSDRILASAEALFAARGYAEPSLRELIAGSGCSTTAFYARFPTKQAVLSALVANLVDAILTAAAEVLPGASTLDEGVELGIDALVRAVGDRKSLVRIALTAEDAATRAAVYERLQALAELLAAAGVANRRVADPGALGWAIVGALELQVRRWAVFGAIEDAQLRDVLLATARAVVPSERTAQGT